MIYFSSGLSQQQRQRGWKLYSFHAPECIGNGKAAAPYEFEGHLGRSWRETDAERADRETLIRDLVEGQYSHPVRIVAFNTTEGWSAT
jgi:hypothetical protein